MEMLKTNQVEARKSSRRYALTQTDMILSFLLHHPYQTRRDIAKELGTEVSSVCAALKKLVKENRIRIAFSIDCPITGKMVACYDLPRHTEVV